MRLNFKQIIQSVGGRYIVSPIDGAEILTGVNWDSREIEDGDLYVALPGERVDGHAFIKDALSRGARGALVTDTPDSQTCILAQELGAAIIEVPNTLHAIEDLAKTWRSRLNCKIIAITGSVGKTTAKNLVRDVCAAKFRTMATLANQNNELGVPNTILRADPDVEVLVVEMGMRGLGQIRELCEFVRPDIGIITNIGETHMELLGTKENIARAKAELFCALPNGSGLAIANASCEFTPFAIDLAHLREREVEIDYFGLGAKDLQGSRVWPENITLDGEGRAKFTLCARGFELPEAEGLTPTLFNMEPDIIRADCHLTVRGEHNAINACAACAAGLALGMNIEDIASALSESTPEAGRLEILQGRDGYLVINDAYNANPDSMRAALLMLSKMNVEGKRIAVLGDMGELGKSEVACHEGVGVFAAELGVDRLICVGELSKNMARAAEDAGMAVENITCVDSVGGALSALEGNLFAGDAVLVKASHSMNLDRVAAGLTS